MQSVEINAGARMLHVVGHSGKSIDGHVPPDFRTQCENALREIESRLTNAGMSITDVLRLTFFLVRPGDVEGLRGQCEAILQSSEIVIMTLIVAGLESPELLVEIEAIAGARGSRSAVYGNPFLANW